MQVWAHTNIHMHTQTTMCTLVMCAADKTYLNRNAQIQPPLSHLSTLHISMSVCCLFCRVPSLLPIRRLSSSLPLPWAVAPVAVHGASYWVAAAKTRKRWTDRRGGKGGRSVGGFKRGKNRERKRSQKGRKLKILPLAAESHWSQCK